MDMETAGISALIKNTNGYNNTKVSIAFMSLNISVAYNTTTGADANVGSNNISNATP